MGSFFISIIYFVSSCFQAFDDNNTEGHYSCLSGAWWWEIIGAIFCEFVAINCHVTDILENNSIDNFRKHDSCLRVSGMSRKQEELRDDQRRLAVQYDFFILSSFYNLLGKICAKIYKYLVVTHGRNSGTSRTQRHCLAKVISLHSIPHNDTAKYYLR